jgi:DNA-binding transcriptional LysR family regulator
MKQNFTVRQGALDGAEAFLSVAQHRSFRRAAAGTVEAIVSGPLIANDFPTMLGAAIEGVGLAQVPEPIAAGSTKAGKLVHVLKPFAPMAPGVFLYYPGRHQMMPKLRSFIDHIKSRSDAANKTRIHSDDRRTRGVKMR